MLFNMALFKKGKKGQPGAKKKGKRMGNDMIAAQGEGYNEMLTPRNEGVQ